MSRRKVPELDTPFSSVEWPIIPQKDQDIILELLCTLLAPLGQYRRDRVASSRGKRSRRRSRQRAKGNSASSEPDGGASLKAEAKVEKMTEKLETKQAKDNVPPLPELARFVDVGLVSITRELAKNATPGAPMPISNSDDPEPTSLPSSTTPSSTPSSSSNPYSAVFIVRSGHPSAFYSHFSQMVAVASQRGAASTPPSPPIRLVGFSKACEDRLSESLGIPRVSSIAIRAGAPQSQGLLAFLEETVPAVDVRWLDEAQAGQYRETQIQVTEVSVGPKRKKKV
ncbi:RNase P and RNase MRP subunit [Sporothrix stenoceras]|uniref:RNase P and RNase MRP subunit n=1 Tax=Sporothrix stenoceras TaxID=5173 RepID=A0ABR3ZFH0_9PEZI